MNDHCNANQPENGKCITCYLEKRFRTFKGISELSSNYLFDFYLTLSRRCYSHEGSEGK